MKKLIKNRCKSIVTILFFAGCIFISSTLQAQNSPRNQARLDSLLKVLDKPGLPDDDFFTTCEELYLIYANDDDNRKALEYVWKALRLAEKTQNYYQLSFFYFYAGGAYFGLFKNDSALYYLEKAIAMKEKANTKGLSDNEDLESLNVQMLSAMGALHHRVGKIELALDNYFKALKLVDKKENLVNTEYPYIKEGILINIAMCYKRMQNYQKAEEYLLKSQKLSREIGDSITLADINARLCDVYLKYGNYEKALELIEEAFRILNSIPDISAFYLIGPTTGMINILINISDYEKALKYALQAVEYAKEIESPEESVIAYSYLARCYLNLKKYKEAEENAFHVLEMNATELHTTNIIYEIIAESNIWLGNKSKAVEYFYKALNSKDEYATQNYQASLSEMEVKYETEKKENEIARQENIIARHKLERRVMAGGLAVSAIILISLWYILRLRKRHNQMLTEINATKDKFFSIISHDLRNPAIAQRDAIQQLLKNAGFWNNEELSLYCSHLLKSANEEVELLHTLLSWAQIQTGRINYIPVTFDLSANLQTDISLIRKMAEFKKITFVNNMPKHAQVTGDSNMLVTVVRNLLTNAVKFTPVGGKITLEISSDTGVARNAPTRISVSDTGTGMTQEQIHHIFNIENLRSQIGTIGEQGSGLGLIVCQELLKKHGTVLHVESEVGKGSTFWFEI